MSYTIEGLRELREALLKAPDDLVQAATQIVREHGQAAARTIIADYPSVTGTLKANVSTDEQYTAVSSRVVVRSRAKHVWMFEHGTRQRKTRKGWNRGAARPAPVSEQAIPAAISERQRMVSKLIALVRAAGFEVTDQSTRARVGPL